MNFYLFQRISDNFQYSVAFVAYYYIVIVDSTGSRWYAIGN